MLVFLVVGGVYCRCRCWWLVIGDWWLVIGDWMDGIEINENENENEKMWKRKYLFEFSKSCVLKLFFGELKFWNGIQFWIVLANALTWLTVRLWRGIKLLLLQSQFIMVPFPTLSLCYLFIYPTIHPSIDHSYNDHLQKSMASLAGHHPIHAPIVLLKSMVRHIQLVQHLSNIFICCTKSSLTIFTFTNITVSIPQISIPISISISMLFHIQLFTNFYLTRHSIHWAHDQM